MVYSNVTPGTTSATHHPVPQPSSRSCSIGMSWLAALMREARLTGARRRPRRACHASGHFHRRLSCHRLATSEYRLRDSLHLSKLPLTLTPRKQLSLRPLLPTRGIVLHAECKTITSLSPHFLKILLEQNRDCL